MADGQIGELGPVVVRHAEADHKLACVLARILPQETVVPTVKGIAPSPNLATRIGVQVRNQFL